MAYINEHMAKQLREELELQCIAFKYLGSPRENPLYINISEYDPIDLQMNFQSTQTDHIFFSIKLDQKIQEFDFMSFWDEFRNFRNEYVSKNHPTIKK